MLLRLWKRLTRQYPKTRVLIEDRLDADEHRQYRWLVFLKRQPWKRSILTYTSPWIGSYDDLLYYLQKQYWDTVRKIMPGGISRQVARQSARKWMKLRGAKNVSSEPVIFPINKEKA